MPLSAPEKNAAYRARMRQSGLRLVQLWVPDIRAAGFAAKAREQSIIARNSRQARVEMDLAESLQDDNVSWR